MAGQCIEVSISRFEHAFDIETRVGGRIGYGNDGAVMVIVDAGRSAAPNPAIGGGADPEHWFAEQPAGRGGGRELKITDLRNTVASAGPYVPLTIFKQRADIILS